jgi:hypothetical protein
MSLIRLRRRLVGAGPDDRGVGMILVIGSALVLTALMIVGTTIASRSLESSRRHDHFEGALAAAESGIDVALANVQHTYDTVGTDSYTTPALVDTYCKQASVVWPFSTLPSANQERAWAKTTLTTLAVVPGCRQSGPTGDYAMLKPIGHQAVYAMAWSPRYGAAEVKTRLIKSEYLFAPYKPSNAILTSGNLELDSSTLVTTAPGNDPNVAAVHSNGTITVPNGNPVVYGPVSSSGTSSASSAKFYNSQNVNGSVFQSAQQSIPNVSASEVWGQDHANTYTGGWYDLCPDGTVHSPNGSAPCLGTQIASDANGALGATGFRGWHFDSSYSPPVWRIGKNPGDGVFYINGGDVNEASGIGNPVAANMTVIAAASTTTCNKVGGSIVWDHVDMQAPSIPNLFMLADQDIKTSSNFYAGSSSGGTTVSGLFVAGDQVDLETSSNGAYGAVVAADQCSAPYNAIDAPVTADIVKNPSVYYDPNAQAPFVGVIDTTLWLEYNSGG